MAEKLSPCLSGIQKVAGSKLSDKFSTLNRIAIKIVDSENQNEAMQLAVDSSELPEALKPLVQVEVARLSEQFEGICEALKSDDSVVFDRALRAKWFFNGSHENCRVQYYQAQIFPVVSLQSRLKIIKALANNLSANPAIAEEFYTALTLMYGEKQAHPLLMACSESFIWNCVAEHKVRLNNRLVRTLFYKYPALVVKYLKLSKRSDDQYERNLRLVNLNSLSDFLPRLIKKCPETFVELLEMERVSYFIRLSHTRTELFLKNSIDALIKDPKLFLPILDQKTVTKKLTDSQFRIVTKNLLPPTLESFQFDDLFEYLKYLPEDKKLPMMISVFKEVYKVNFLNCTEKITPTVMRLLPRNIRIKQAKINVQKDSTGKIKYSSYPWVCYLAPKESIPYLKDFIIKSSHAYDRCDLLERLIFTCAINSDSNALLEVLEYISTKHKNESGSTLLNVLRELSKEYDLKSPDLTLEHWDVIYYLVKLLYFKTGISFYDPEIKDLIPARIRFDLANNYPITDKISLLAEYIIKWWDGDWNILKDNLSYNRKCLEEFMGVLPSKIENKKEGLDINLVIGIMKSFNDFNERNSKSKSPLEMVTIKNYPLILDYIKKCLNDKDAKKSQVERLKRVLRKTDKELYKELVTQDEEEIDLESPKVIQLLKNDPEKIAKNWELYLEKCMDSIRNPWAQRFVKLCRWYQDLPIKFADQSLNEVTEKKQDKGLIVLGLLFEGSAFAQVAEAFVPTSTTIDPDEEDAADDYKMSSTIPMAFNVVNPPVSLDFILKFCVGDYIHTTVNCLENVSRRTALPKVISFATTLMDRPISIKKHGIRLFCTVADVKQLRGILINLWRSETHQTIRTLVFKNMFKVFESIPNDETWGMICECIDGLKPDDKDTFESLRKFDSIPNEYIAHYVRKLFCLFRRLGDVENGLEPCVVWCYITNLLIINHNILVLLPEELHNEIIDKYVLDLSLPKNVLCAGHHYLIDYIMTAREKSEDRLNRFKNVFVKIVNESWDIPHPTEPSFYPANYFVKNITRSLMFYANKLHEPNLVRLIEVAAESFNSTVKPQQDLHSYLNLTFASLLSKDKFSPKEVACKVNALLPSLLKIFSTELISFIARSLSDYLNLYFDDNKSDNRLGVVEGLIESNNDQATILAAQFLSLQRNSPSSSRLLKIIDTLKGHSNPTVVSTAYIIVYGLL
ncbi:uncharacterized protein LOC130675115 isoform X1 [Microplitis mediator]|uniref:uncharacterized protein LOC130675115 isoform X1 n=1 Tax=Microplitis mediator TaxID=375433 RepID=UPI0025557877|nr:uncharacterized protein LOC130675115 isoform X1 [Microplitis mediator]XP_057336591.1 uncharacterized protein LOC130675115 isoform X1 [Microplitis mediator]